MDAIETRLRNIIARVTGLPRDVDGDKDLYFDLGVASAHALELLSELESQFGIAVPDDEFVAATTVRKLTALMTDLIRSQQKESSSRA